MLLKFIQFANSPPPPLVTEDGIIILVKPVQLPNAFVPIEFNVEDSVTSVKPVQPLKEELPIAVILLLIIKACAINVVSAKNKKLKQKYIVPYMPKAC